MIDTTYESDNPFRLRKNLLERYKLIMAVDDKIRDVKLQCKEAEQISALSSGKIDKYEYLTGEQTLPPDQRGVIEQAVFRKQIKAIKEHGKQVVEFNALIKKIRLWY